MALVDFSDAAITMVNKLALTYGYFALNQTANLYDSNNNTIVTSQVRTITNIDTGGWQIVYTGQFTADGAELYTFGKYWHITGISFSAGDTYSFAIQCDITT